MAALIGKEGPRPIPSFALVQVVGCLTEGPDQAWMLTNSSEPIRTRSPKPTVEELKLSEVKPLGTQVFRLLDVFPKPDSYKGHKVDARGFLIREPNDDRINATSVQTVARSCP